MPGMLPAQPHARSKVAEQPAKGAGHISAPRHPPCAAPLSPKHRAGGCAASSLRPATAAPRAAPAPYRGAAGGWRDGEGALRRHTDFANYSASRAAPPGRSPQLVAAGREGGSGGPAARDPHPGGGGLPKPGGDLPGGAGARPGAPYLRWRRQRGSARAPRALGGCGSAE